MDADCLPDMIDLTLHLPDLRGLEVEHLEEVVGQGVDLISNTGQALGRVALGLLQRCSLIVTL